MKIAIAFAYWNIISPCGVIG